MQILSGQYEGFFKESLIYFILKLLGIFTAYFFTFLVTRFWGAMVWGIFALSLTIFQIFVVLGKLGLDMASLKLVAHYNARSAPLQAFEVYLKALKIALFSAIFFSIFLYVSAPIIAEKIFHKPQVMEPLKLIIWGLIPAIWLGINNETLRAFKKIKLYALLQNVLTYFWAIIILLLSTYFEVLVFEPEERIILAYIAGIFLAFLVSILGVISQFRQKLKKIAFVQKDYVKTKEIISLAFPILLSTSAAMLMNWMDTIMLGIWRSEEEIGIYNVAARIAIFLGFILGSINSIAAPKFAEFWSRNEIHRIKKIAQASSKVVFWCSFPFFLFFLIFPKQILGFFGKEFSAGAPVLIILGCGYFFDGISGSVGLILRMTAYQRFERNVTFLVLVLNMLLNWALIPRYGINGAAWATALSIITWNVILGFKVKEVLGAWAGYFPGRG